MRILGLLVAAVLVTTTAEAVAIRPKMIERPSPNGEERPSGTVIDTIVIHDTEDNNLHRVLGLFCSRRFGRSPHFTIDKAGKIYKHLDPKARGAHAGRSFFSGKPRVNDFSIGIELVNLGDGKDPFTEAQYHSLTKLVTWLKSTYDIKNDHIVGHKDIAIPRGRKADPAKNFDFPRFLRSLS